MNVFWLVIIISVVVIAASIAGMRYFDTANSNKKDKKEH